MTYTIERNYATRAYGEVGKVNLIADVKSVTLDGNALPDGSVEYLLHFALQSLQDAYAGAKSLDEAKGSWAKKRDALIAGTIGVRASGDGASMETIVGRSVMRNTYKLACAAKEGKDSPKWKTFTGLSDGDQAAKLDEWLAGPQGEALEGAIATELKLRHDRAVNKKDAAKAVDFDI